MRFTRRTAAAVLVAALALSACGGSDGPVADPSTTDSDELVANPDDPNSPNATVAPDLPDNLVDVIGPVEVIGDELPPLTTDTPSADPAAGMPAPVLVGLDYDGRPVRIDATAAGPTMVVFLAHWCPACNAEIPVINQLRDDGLIPREVSVVAVSTAVTPGQPNFPPDRWLDDKDWTFPAMADGVDMETESFVASSAFGVTGFPFVTLIDGNGNVAARWSGGRNPGDIATLLEGLANIS